MRGVFSYLMQLQIVKANKSTAVHAIVLNTYHLLAFFPVAIFHSFYPLSYYFLQQSPFLLSLFPQLYNSYYYSPLFDPATGQFVNSYMHLRYIDPYLSLWIESESKREANRNYHQENGRDKGQGGREGETRRGMS